MGILDSLDERIEEVVARKFSELESELGEAAGGEGDLSGKIDLLTAKVEAIGATVGVYKDELKVRIDNFGQRVYTLEAIDRNQSDLKARITDCRREVSGIETRVFAIEERRDTLTRDVGSLDSRLGTFEIEVTARADRLLELIDGLLAERDRWASSFRARLKFLLLGR